MQASEKVFAITGASGVMLICYLIPVALHLMARQQELKSEKPASVDGRPLNSVPFADAMAILGRMFKRS